MTTYHGSCHCGAVRFAVDLEPPVESGRCNCSICMKRRAWNIVVKPGAFRLLDGREALTDYQFGSRQGHNLFCRICGCAPFSEGHVEQLGGEIVAVQPTCLDDMPEDELAALPISYGNGRDNLWWEAPAVTNYL